MSERTDEVRSWLTELRSRREAFLAEVAAARRGATYSDARQIERIRGLRQQYAVEARRRAEEAWRTARRAESECGKDLQRARAEQSASKDESRHRGLATEITARLGDSGPGSKSGKSRMAAIADLRRKYRRQHDADALRVLRLVALPFVNRVRPGSEDWPLANVLRAKFAEDEAAEPRSEVKLLEAESAELRHLVSELRSEILAAEVAATGVRSESGMMNVGGTPWAIEIMGEVPDPSAAGALRLRGRLASGSGRVGPSDGPVDRTA